MKPWNLTSKPAQPYGSHHKHQPKLRIQSYSQGGKFWLRFFATILLLSSILGPAGALPARAAPLDPPNLLGPSDSSTITITEASPLAIPEFSWTAVAGATKYRLQVSNDITFITKLIDITTSNTTYTPISSSGFSDGTWYWQVRVESPAPVGNYSSTWSFTKQWATSGNSPALISPADMVTIDFYDAPVFSWGPVMGAAKYKLQIYSSPGGYSSTIYTATTLSTIHQPNAKLANATYYWRVVPVDAGGRDGTPSAERSFTTNYNLIPTLLEPDDFATPTFTPNFRWTAVRGAQFYRLQYSTDPSFNATVTQIDTRNTAYTPTATLSNDVNYYWRVRVISGNSITDWTPSRRFIKGWYIKPVPLTPPNGYQNQRFPVFSWTPVPGAAYYIVEISKFFGFTPIYETGEKTANTFYTPRKYDGSPTTFYWRVTAYDGNDKKGATSDVWSYASAFDSVAPEQVYPLFYYTPNSFAGYPSVVTNPYEDRTVPLPVFIWHRVLTPALDLFQGQVYGEGYRVQVSSDANFGTIDWTVDTENLTATPTSSNSFTPAADTDYFWRVCVLSGGFQASPWSQVWKTQIDVSDASLQLPPTSGGAPTLLRPTNGYEYAEVTPLLEWFPLSGASSYDVEISLNDSFTSIVDNATVPYPAYAPTQNLAQRSLGAVNFGVYYWRVSPHGSGTWSETRRYQISAQSQWRFSRRLGELVNPAIVGTDVAGELKPESAAFDLTDILAVQTRTTWHYGFHVAPASSTVTYGIYLDLDGWSGSGASTDAWGYDVTAAPAHQPEYAIYLLQEGGAFTADKIYIYHWLGSGWSTSVTLASVGGRLSQYWDPTVGRYYVEFLGPNSAIGFNSSYQNHYYMSLFSAPVDLIDPDGKVEQPEDSAPTDGKIPGKGPIAAFAPVLYIDHPWQIGSDPGDNADPNYELTDLHAGQDQGNWYFGFHIPTSYGKSVTYALYLDIDHQEGSGGTFDPLGYGITTISAYRPEYVIYILEQAGYLTASNTYIYHWLGSAWESYSLASIGGNLGQYSNECNNYVEIRVPNTPIGYQGNTGSYTVSFMSLQAGGIGTPLDSVPSDQNVPGSGLISRFTNVTERMNLSMPPNNPGLNSDTNPSIIYPTIQPFFWDFPILTPAAGAVMKAYRDPGFTSEVATYNQVSDTVYYGQIAHSWGNDFLGDNSYYWRIQPKYEAGALYSGAWTQGWRFERKGFIAQNLRTTVTFATPTFSWDMVEGAESYDLQVSTNPNFGTTVININTRQTSYTDISTLPNAIYYWRVLVHRNGSVLNNWTSAQTFTLDLPAPTGLNHQPAGVVGRAPTLCWTPLVINSGAGTPFFAAWKYRIQVSTDPTYSTTVDNNIDTEQSCWTPIKGYADGTYYWRVATFDGSGRLGNYSGSQTFTKQYPVTTLVSPLNGVNLASTPTFIWTPVNGAARYKLDVSLYPNFSPTIESITTDNVRYTPTSAYATQKTYYWRVAIVDADGRVGPYTGATIILDPNPYKIYLPLTRR